MLPRTEREHPIPADSSFHSGGIRTSLVCDHRCSDEESVSIGSGAKQDHVISSWQGEISAKAFDNLCVPVTTNGAAQYSCAKLHELYGTFIQFGSDITIRTTARSSLQYPNAPQPESTPTQVQQFLIQVFLINRLGLDESEANEAAEALAAKIHVTGYGLYILSKETLVGTLWLEGEVIYRILQDGRYRYERGPWPALKIVSRILRLVAGGSGAYQLGKEGKDRNLTVSYICVGLITFIIALYYLCTTKRVVNSKRFWPERIKVRNKTAAGALSFVPW